MTIANEEVVLNDTNVILGQLENIKNLLSEPITDINYFADAVTAFLRFNESKLSAPAFQAALGQIGIINFSASLASLGVAITDYKNGTEKGLFNIVTSLNSITQSVGTLLIAYGGATFSAGGANAAIGTSLITAGKNMGYLGLAFSGGLYAGYYGLEKISPSIPIDLANSWNYFANGIGASIPSGSVAVNDYSTIRNFGNGVTYEFIHDDTAAFQETWSINNGLEQTNVYRNLRTGDLMIDYSARRAQ